ncbi:MAG: phospho-N-acetylmuramoyl-pentapeptide-transferase [Chloroflexi bacterium]|nr:phospho-N-acetylmuramoyl-pentapeptide-transferase [Chloroflexota bacterium]
MSASLYIHLLTSGLLISFILTMPVFPAFINFMKNKSMGQQIRGDGPKDHISKAGTPTLGGLVFIVTAGIIAVVLTKADPRVCWFFLIVGLAMLLGFADDIIQVRAKRSLGLRARYKFILQILIGVLLAWVLVKIGQPHNLIIPFIGQVQIGIYAASFIAILTLVSTMNAVNLTDGLDGLAGGLSILALAAFGAIAALKGDFPLLVATSCTIGTCMAFLWFNFNPAKIFMGDTGSLGLGAAIAALAVLTRSEFYLPLIGGIFVIETLSVIIQVIYFKITKGKRIFKMSPIHHHFCIDGPPEYLVTVRFWLVGAILAVLGLVIYTWGGLN